MILDFGCGDCRRLDHWLQTHGGNNVVGIDVESNIIKKAKQSIRNGTEFLVCDGHNLPFKDGSFHYIHIHGVLHHLSDISKTLTEISRTLNGILDVDEPVDDYVVFRLARAVAKQWRGMGIKSFFYSHQLEQQLRKHFRIEQTKCRYSSLLSNILRYSILNYYYGSIFSKLDLTCTSLLKKLGLLKYFCVHIQILASS